MHLKFPGAALVCVLAFSWFELTGAAQPAQENAEQNAPQIPPAAPLAPEPEEGLELERGDPAGPAAPTERSSRSAARDNRGNHRDAIISVGSNSHLAAGQTAEALISIVGSSTAEGEVIDAVISVFGDTRATAPVGNDAVAIFGSAYVNSRVGNDVVAIFGDVELGPEATIGGNVVAVGGTVSRDAASVVQGDIQEILLPGAGLRFEWLQPWLKHGLLYGRPLAMEPGLGWAWTLAFAFLGLYVLLALLFSASVEKCAETLETRPGHSLLAALLVMLAIPAMMVLLAITIIGIPLIPFAAAALFCAGLFGKVVMLAAIGRRLTGFIGAGPLGDSAFTVLVGGCVVLGLYMVPVLGFILFKLLGILGLGVVAYTIILNMKSKRSGALAAPTAASASGVEIAAAAPGSSESAHTGAATAAEPSAAPEFAAGTPLPPGSVATLPRAGFLIRMAALFLDAVLVGVALSFLNDNGELTLLALAIYGALLWKFKGTTIGGLICNLQVIRTDGREIDWSTAIVRALGCFLSVAAAGLGFLWIAIDRDSQAWHDKIAGTAVVRVAHGVSRW